MPSEVGLNVSRETLDALEHFSALTLKWTDKINLISRSTIPDIWNRHIVDSAQIYQYAQVFNTWADIGSGGGYPGIVAATIAKSENPTATFTFIESDARKCTFLRTAIRELDLQAKVITDRIEKAPAQAADVISARALGSLETLMPLAARHLKADGTALFMKGRRHAEELRAINAQWVFDLDHYPSITDAESCLLAFKRISRAA